MFPPKLAPQMGNLPELKQIFNSIQACTPREYNEKLGESLALICADDAFLTILYSILACKRSKLPPRILNFLSRIFEELDEANPRILRDIFNYLEGFTKSKNTKCRQHALQLLHAILTVNQYDLSLVVLQSISERLFDREMCVRKEALLICLMYQECALGETLKLEGILKDAIRFDQSAEIRKIGIQGCAVKRSTWNCLLERCSDASPQVRRAFWTDCYNKIAVAELSQAQRLFLMKAACTEREFDAKSTFVRTIDELGVEQFAELFNCDGAYFCELIESYLLRSTVEYTLDKLTLGTITVLRTYYRIREERDGRDALNLPELGEFLGVLQEHCERLECMIRDAATDDLSESIIAATKIATGLFKLLAFYDLFAADERKQVLKIISALLTRCSMKEIVEEAVILCKRICVEDITKFLGIIIKKIRGTPLCYAVCECVMKHLPYSELHEAIFQEIVIVNMDESIEIIYWYYYLKPSGALQELFLSLLPHRKALEGATDLVIEGMVEPPAIEPCLRMLLEQYNENAVIPTAKLLTAEKINATDYFKFLMLIYYSTETESIQQYLSLFFHERFILNPEPVIAIYCDMLQLITDNYRVFADQALYWIANSKMPNGAQQLFYTICLFICKNYESMKSRKLLFFTLERIPIEATWDPLMTKRIIYLFTQIIRLKPKEQTEGLITKLMEIDNGLPLSPDEYSVLNGLLEADC